MVEQREASLRQPNVVFVFADQMRAQATSYAGNPNAHTPELDRLAEASVNFTHAVSGHPVCCPYRASLLTGQYPLTHSVYVNDVPLDKETTSLAQAFGSAGYDTAYIGKWHLYGSPDGAYGRRHAFVPRESRQGFDYWKAFECSHNYTDSFYHEGDDPTPKRWAGYDAMAQTEDACSYIRRHAGGEVPFLLMLSWGPPHDPYDMVPEEHKAKLRDRAIALRPNVPADQRQRAIETLRGYYAHIAVLDDCIGMLLDTLDESGIAEDTIFAYTSDHGDMHGSHGLLTKHCPWDEAIRVPFLLRYPRRLGPRGRRSPLLIDAPDIMPTLLGLVGLPIPESVQGRDLSPQLAGEAAPDHEMSAFLSVPVSYGMLRTQGLPEYRGVRTSRHTYVRSIRGPWLLYDNEQDPYQMDNLCGRSEHAALQDRLEGMLQEWLARLGDEFLPGDSYLQRDGLTHYKECTTEWGAIQTPWSVG